MKNLSLWNGYTVGFCVEVLPAQKRRAEQAKVRKEGLRRSRRNPSFRTDNFALTLVDVPVANSLPVALT